MAWVEILASLAWVHKILAWVKSLALVTWLAWIKKCLAIESYSIENTALI